MSAKPIIFDWRRTPGLPSFTALIIAFLYAPLAGPGHLFLQRQPDDDGLVGLQPAMVRPGRPQRRHPRRRAQQPDHRRRRHHRLDRHRDGRAPWRWSAA